MYTHGMAEKSFKLKFCGFKYREWKMARLMRIDAEDAITDVNQKEDSLYIPQGNRYSLRTCCSSSFADYTDLKDGLIRGTREERVAYE